MIDAITDLVTDGEFRAGLLYGLVAAAAVGFGAVVTGRLRPWAGAALGVAAVLALGDRFSVAGTLAAGLAALAVAGAVTAGGHPAVRLAVALPGAVLVARATGLDEPAWAAPTVVAATAIGGVLVAECDRVLGRAGLTPLLVAATALGIYGTTPDTEHAMVLAGVALAVALLGGPWPLASLGAGGAFVVAGVVSWTVVVDGHSRPGAVVGGVACLGLLLIEPVVRAVAAATRARAPSADAPPDPATGGPPLADLAVLAALHLGVVAAASRVAGLSTSAVRALVLSAAAYALAAAGLVAYRGRRLAGASRRDRSGQAAPTVARRRP